LNLFRNRDIIKKRLQIEVKIPCYGVEKLKNARKMIASVLCAAALVGTFSISASAATSSTSNSYSSGKITTYTAGRW